MIQVRGLTKFYGRLPAIKDVNFRVETGEIVGFLGPNGAGKSTTMRILTCFSPATSGEVNILGMDVRDKSLEIRRKVGYLPETAPLYTWMRVKSYLDFVARAKGAPASEREREIQRVAQAVGIDHVMNRIIRALSKGYKQRVGLAQALIGDPPILVLDEPTIGLDPRQIREIRELVKGFAHNRTVILSTHILPEVSQVCNRVIIINKGTIVAEDTPANLTRTHTKSSRLKVAAKAPLEDLRALLQGLPGVLSVHPKDAEAGCAGVVVESAQDGAAPLVARAVVEKGWDLLALSPIDVSLEDVFIDLVTEEPVTEDSASAEGGKEAA
jgi:ABC-2 type transport system ATP-binding protein